MFSLVLVFIGFFCHIIDFIESSVLFVRKVKKVTTSTAARKPRSSFSTSSYGLAPSSSIVPLVPIDRHQAEVASSLSLSAPVSSSSSASSSSASSSTGCLPSVVVTSVATSSVSAAVVTADSFTREESTSVEEVSSVEVVVVATTTGTSVPSGTTVPSGPSSSADGPGCGYIHPVKLMARRRYHRRCVVSRVAARASSLPIVRVLGAPLPFSGGAVRRFARRTVARKAARGALPCFVAASLFALVPPVVAPASVQPDPEVLPVASSPSGSDGLSICVPSVVLPTTLMKRKTLEEIEGTPSPKRVARDVVSSLAWEGTSSMPGLSVVVKRSVGDLSGPARVAARLALLKRRRVAAAVTKSRCVFSVLRRHSAPKKMIHPLRVVLEEVEKQRFLLAARAAYRSAARGEMRPVARGIFSFVPSARVAVYCGILYSINVDDEFYNARRRSAGGVACGVGKAGRGTRIVLRANRRRKSPLALLADEKVRKVLLEAAEEDVCEDDALVHSSDASSPLYSPTTAFSSPPSPTSDDVGDLLSALSLEMFGLCLCPVLSLFFFGGATNPWCK
ncbi:unnamed protein product [Cunninghamella blakesleeana]